MLAAIGAWVAKSAVGSFLKGVPKQVWIAFIVIAALVGAVVWHQHKAGKALKRADATGYARAMHEIELKAKALKKKVDDLNAKIATAERKLNDAQALRISRDADTLRLRGPGKAVCPGVARLPAPADKHGAASGNGDAAGPRMSADVRAAVPWGWLVGRAEQCDLNRAEVVSWRSWYDRISKEWPKH